MKRKPGRTIFFFCGVGLVLVLVGLFISYVAIPVLSPIASAKVPQSCIDAASRRRSPSRLIVASDERSELILVGNTLLIVQKADLAVVRSLQFPDDIVAATLHDGVAYIFNDAIGYFIDASTGEPVRNILETDTYRVNDRSNGTIYVQTNVELSALRPSRGILSHLRLDLHTYAFGCRIR